MQAFGVALPFGVALVVNARAVHVMPRPGMLAQQRIQLSWLHAFYQT